MTAEKLLSDADLQIIGTHPCIRGGPCRVCQLLGHIRAQERKIACVEGIVKGHVRIAREAEESKAQAEDATRLKEFEACCRAACHVCAGDPPNLTEALYDENTREWYHGVNPLDPEGWDCMASEIRKARTPKEATGE